MFLIAIIAVLAALAALGVVTAVALRRVVPTNMVHIVQSGRKTISYGKGRDSGNVYYAWPNWLPVLGVVITEFPESIFDVSLVGYDAYDQGRLPFMVDVKAFYRITDSDAAAQRVATFAQLTDQLGAVLQGAVRRVLSTNHLENIMQDRAALGEQFTKEVDANLKEWGVQTVKMIEFMDIHDSGQSLVIHNMMAKEKSRIEKESRVTVAANMQTAANAEIDAQRAVDVQKQDAVQQVGLRTAEQEKNVGIARERAKQEINDQAKVTTEKQMAVIQVQQVRQAEINKGVAVVNAEAQQQVTVVSANAQKESRALVADGDLQAALKHAEGVKAEGLARGAAETALQMAPVTAQLALAKEIGGNEGYQTYLVQVRRVEAEQAVGTATANALAKADVKIIANSGTIQGGAGSLGELLSAKGGTAIGGMVSALAQNPDVAAAVGKVVALSKTNGAKPAA